MNSSIILCDNYISGNYSNFWVSEVFNQFNWSYNGFKFWYYYTSEDINYRNYTELTSLDVSNGVIKLNEWTGSLGSLYYNYSSDNEYDKMSFSWRLQYNCLITISKLII